MATDSKNRALSAQEGAVSMSSLLRGADGIESTTSTGAGAMLPLSSGAEVAGDMPSPRTWSTATSTSRAAAASARPRSSELCRAILRLVTTGPKTPEEIAIALDIPVNTARARICDLHKAGRLRDSGRRGKSLSGRPVIAWEALPEAASGDCPPPARALTLSAVVRFALRLEDAVDARKVLADFVTLEAAGFLRAWPSFGASATDEAGATSYRPSRRRGA